MQSRCLTVIAYGDFSRLRNKQPEGCRCSTTLLGYSRCTKFVAIGVRSNRLERLTGDRQGEYSIRINRQWRICFRWMDGAPHDVEIVDYHD